MAILGIDLGGTKLALAVFSAAGELQSRETVAIPSSGGPAVGELIVRRARALTSGAEDDAVTAIGLAVPGIYHRDRGTVWAPNIPGWDDYPLLDEMRSALGDDASIAIDSDRAAYILGETWRGAARGSRDAVFLAVGTGIGAGILAGGQILRGHQDIAGAIGWMALDRPHRPDYTRWGCFEDHASGPGIVRHARALLEDDATGSEVLSRIGSASLTTADVIAAYETDGVARRVIDDAIAFWSMAVANLVSLFNPETIVFGGGVFGPAVRFLDRIRDEAKRWAQPIAMRTVTLTASTLGNDAGLYGAAAIALHGARKQDETRTTS